MMVYKTEEFNSKLLLDQLWKIHQIWYLKQNDSKTLKAPLQKQYQDSD